MFITKVFAQTKKISSLKQSLSEGDYRDSMGEYSSKEGLEKLIAKSEREALESHHMFVFPGSSLIYMLISWLLPLMLGVEESLFASSCIEVVLGLLLFFFWINYLTAIVKLEKYQDQATRTPVSDWFVYFMLAGLYIPVLYFVSSLRDLLLGGV